MKKFILGFVLGALIFGGISVFAIGPERIEAVFAEYNILVNGKTVDLEDSRIISKDGSSYLPLRKTANLLGYDVTYKADSRTIVLDSVSVQETNLNSDTITLNDDGGVDMDIETPVGSIYIMDIMEQHSGYTFSDYNKDTQTANLYFESEIVLNDIPLTLVKGRAFVESLYFENNIKPIIETKE